MARRRRSGGRGSRRSGSSKGGGSGGARRKLLINAREFEESRIAIIENGRLEEYYIERQSLGSTLGNIYKARITNIEKSIGAAFVEFGHHRQGFLHVSDLCMAAVGEDERGLLAPVQEARESANDDDVVEMKPKKKKKKDGDEGDDESAESAAGEDEDGDEDAPKRRRRRGGRRGRGGERSKADGEGDDEEDDSEDDESSDDDVRGARNGRGDGVAVAEADDDDDTPVLDPDELHDELHARDHDGSAEDEALELLEDLEDDDDSDDDDDDEDDDDSEDDDEDSDDDDELTVEDIHNWESSSDGDDEDSDDDDSDESDDDDSDDDDASEQSSDAKRSSEDSDDDDEGESSGGRRRRSRRGRRKGWRSKSESGDENGEGESESSDSDDDDDDDEERTAAKEVTRGGRRRGRGRGRRGGTPPAKRTSGNGGNGGGRREQRRLPAIEDILHKGQEIVVQVIKDGIGTKGPTLTTYLSLPGRFVVLMPGIQKRGVSRKVTDGAERDRLKGVVRELECPEGLGFIVRTAGHGCTAEDLQRDLDYLLRLWEQMRTRVSHHDAPVLLYQESDVVIRTLRDLYDGDGEIVIDDKATAAKARDFVSQIMPEAVEKVVEFTDQRPLFHHFAIEKEIAELLHHRVELKSGISLVMEQTEALVAIDVNSGRYKPPPGSTIDDTAFQVNSEAAVEIARQIRLRDLGGVVVIDFIDMRAEKQRKEIERLFKERLRNDRARIKVARISPFGILELTRQRVRPSLKRSVHEKCPYCSGTGFIPSDETSWLSVIRQIRENLSKPGAVLVVTVRPEVAEAVLNQQRALIAQLEQESRKTIFVRADHRFAYEDCEIRAMVTLPESDHRRA